MDVYIIIPFHNEEQYIKSTIESIINQSYAVKKLLLVNDNSNDKSHSLVKKYVDTYDWISEISIKSIQKHLPGEKVIKAFNFGLNNIDNNYDIICKFDADIILPNNYIEKITSVINSRNAGNSYKESEAFSSKIKNKYGTLAKNLIPINNMTIIDQEERSKISRSGAKTP